MATITYDSALIGPRTVSVGWTPMTHSGTDVGQPFSLTPGADRSVQVYGTFGASGTLLIEGTNDADPATGTWATLNDPQGNALSFTAAKIEQVLEYTRWIRPRVTNGDGTTSLSVRAIAGG